MASIRIAEAPSRQASIGTDSIPCALLMANVSVDVRSAHRRDVFRTASAAFWRKWILVSPSLIEPPQDQGLSWHDLVFSS
jgi:hypothetical protein